MKPPYGAEGTTPVAPHEVTRPVVPRQRPGGPGVRLVVVSDHSLVSEAVRMALTSRGFEAVSLTTPLGHGQQRDFALRVNRLQPSVGLLLYELEDRSLLRDAVAVVSSARIRWLLLTRARDGAAWGALLEAGVVGILPMSTSLDALSEALGQVALGRPIMAEDIRSRVLEEWHREGEQARRVTELMKSLTPRELAVLAQLHDGFTVRLIAADSGVSEGTVRSQVKSILRKLEVSSQLAAVAAYRQMTQQVLVDIDDVE